jgi:hypothetical protein
MKYLTRFNEAKEDKYYTNLFINSYRDPKIQEMIPSNMINWDFHDKDGHDIGMLAVIRNSYDMLKKFFDNVKKVSNNNGFTCYLINAMSKNNLDSVKLIIENIDKFSILYSDKVLEELQDSIDSCLRFAGENSNIEAFDFLLNHPLWEECGIEISANPNNWWVIHWTTKRSNREMYSHLMKNVLKLNFLPNRKKVIEMCNTVSNRWKDISTDKLKELK